MDKQRRQSKRRRTSVTRYSDENTRKRIKIESKQLALMNWEVFEKQMKNITREAIKVFHGVVDNDYDESRCDAMLSILKKVCDGNYWVSETIISDRVEVLTFLEKQTLSQSEHKKFKVYLENWIDHKIKKLPNKTKELKCEAAAREFKEMVCKYGVKLDTLESKIRERKDERNGKNAHNHTRTSTPAVQQCSPLDLMNGCRLCCSKESSYFVDLNDYAGDNYKYKDLIETYCRVQLDDNYLLPQRVCLECKNSLEMFIRFCNTIDDNQKMMRDELVKVKDEPIDYTIAIPSPPLSYTPTPSESPAPILSASYSSLSTQISTDIHIEAVHSAQCPSEFEIPNNETFTNDFENIFHEFEQATVTLPNSVLRESLFSTREDIEKDDQPPVERESTENDDRPPVEETSNESDQPLVARPSMEKLMENLKDCHVFLPRLDVKFVPSDDECYDTDVDEDYQRFMEDVHKSNKKQHVKIVNGVNIKSAKKRRTK